jgi:hypothetical protein
MRVDGSDKRNISNHSFQDFDPVWSPDGSQIAFVSNSHGGFPQLFIMNKDGTNREQITTNGGREGTGNAYVYQPSWSPDGKEIVFTSIMDSNVGSSYEIFTINIENRQSKSVTSNSYQDLHPDWQKILKNAQPTTTTSAVSNSCSAANSIGTASLTRVSDLVVQVDAVVTACSYEIVVVSDTGETYRTGIININRIGQISVKEQFINAKCDTGYSFYTNAWTEQNGKGTINRTPSNRMLSATCAPSSVVKPSTPTFSSVNFSGNTININVNIGSSASSRPDKVYLVAPKLGVNSSTPLEGKISGSTASWSLPLTNILSGVSIPLEIVGEKNGVASEPLIGSYTKPAASITAVPPAPTNYSSRIVGTSAIITIQVSEKESSRASSAHLYSSALGIKKNPGLQGDVVGTKALIEVPIKASMAGKKYPLTIYLKNSKGESKPLNATLTIPKAPKAPTLPTAVPSQSVAKTVICTRSNQTRTFAGTECPPGWEKR